MHPKTACGTAYTFGIRSKGINGNDMYMVSFRCAAGHCLNAAKDGLG